MSTDTDRIVNFCNSFHQFWSLPFQVIVSLALLYQQVCMNTWDSMYGIITYILGNSMHYVPKM